MVLTLESAPPAVLPARAELGGGTGSDEVSDGGGAASGGAAGGGGAGAGAGGAAAGGEGAAAAGGVLVDPFLLLLAPIDEALDLCSRCSFHLVLSSTRVGPPVCPVRELRNGGRVTGDRFHVQWVGPPSVVSG